MPLLSELSFPLRTFLKAYRWRKISDTRAAELPRRLAECRVALLSSAALTQPEDVPFDESVKGGDRSFRTIPADADVQALEEHHRSDSFDHRGIEADKNVGLPLDRLHELATAGTIGEVAPRHVSVMGSITAPGRYLKQTVPTIADLLEADGVDAVLLVPV